MNRILTFCIAKFSYWLFLLCDLRATMVYGCLMPACKALHESTATGLRGRYARVRASYRRLARLDRQAAMLNAHLREVGGSGAPAAHLWTTVSRTTIFYFRASVAFGRFGLATADVGILQVEIATVGIGLKVVDREMGNQMKRAASLRSILEASNSPVFLHQLVMWLVTPSKHIDDVLGDFTEGYERRRNKNGDSSALQWCNRQIAREVWLRFRTICSLLSGLSALHHWVDRHHK